MEKMLVVVFDNQPKAFEGLQALRGLDDEGEISVYGAQMVAKEPGGDVRIIEHGELSGFPAAAGGAALGAIIGLLGGPVGVPLGAAAGAIVGSIGDMEEAGVTDEFVNDVGTVLTPGKFALVADIVEEWVTPLDTRMERIGGVVFRRARTVVKTTQEDRDAAAHQAEMDELKAERKQARSDRLEKIDARIDHLRARLENALERKRVKMRLREQQREAKIQALQAKADQAKGQIRRRQETRIDELRRDYAEKAAVS